MKGTGIGCIGDLALAINELAPELDMSVSELCDELKYRILETRKKLGMDEEKQVEDDGECIGRSEGGAGVSTASKDR